MILGERVIYPATKIMKNGRIPSKDWHYFVPDTLFWQWLNDSYKVSTEYYKCEKEFAILWCILENRLIMKCLLLQS